VGYGLVIAGDAEADLKRLSLWPQEEVLDELEHLLADPGLLPSLSTESHSFFAFAREHAGVRHYVTIVLTCNDTSKTITILGIDHRPKPISP
jgi:hypothetical protein